MTTRTVRVAAVVEYDEPAPSWLLILVDALAEPAEPAEILGKDVWYLTPKAWPWVRIKAGALGLDVTELGQLDDCEALVGREFTAELVRYRGDDSRLWRSSVPDYRAPGHGCRPLVGPERGLAEGEA